MQISIATTLERNARLVEKINEILLSSAPIRQRVEQMLLFIKRQKDLLDILSKNELIPALAARIKSHSGANEEALAVILKNEPQWVRPMVAMFATAGFSTLVLDWYKEDFARTTGEMTDLCCRMLGRPLFDFTA